MEQYPAVRFLVQHGRRLTYVVAALPILVAILGTAFAGWGTFSLLVGLLSGIGLGFAFRTFAELTQIIADMLLPQ